MKAIVFCDVFKSGDLPEGIAFLDPNGKKNLDEYDIVIIITGGLFNNTISSSPRPEILDGKKLVGRST